MKKYNTESEITFNSASAHISYSTSVTNRYDRQKISMIIANSGVTDRSFSDLSAEWELHNLAYNVISNVNQFNSTYLNRQADRALHVDLNYFDDDDKNVIRGTKILEVAGWQ